MYKDLDNKKNVLRFYRYYWPICERYSNVYNTLGMHIGYYEKDTKNFSEASMNMDRYIGKLLELNKFKQLSILDAGCGIGGTCIHLGKKYPKINFVGITLVPEQFELAVKFLKEKNLKNIHFFLRDFIDTGFQNCSFDGIFALESMAHAQNKKKFVEEMHRILKKKGKLVVIGQFQTNKTLNPLIQKLYNLTLKAGGVPNLISLDTFSTYLKEYNFKNIKIFDISKNVRWGLIREMVIGIPHFIACIIKKITNPRKYKPMKDTDFLIGISSLSIILGLKKISNYYAISCVKND